MADESPRGTASNVVPSHLLDARPLREPTPEELERYRWTRMARWGRHGWAARGTGAVGTCGGIVLGMARVIDPRWLGATSGDGLAWMLVLGVPALAGVYRVLLAQWDQEAVRFGGGRLSLDAWRGEDGMSGPRRPLRGRDTTSEQDTGDGRQKAASELRSH